MTVFKEIDIEHGDSTAPTVDQRRSGAMLVVNVMGQFGGVVVLILLLALFSAMKPETFLTVSTLSSLLSSVPVDVCIALAALLPLVAGEFDLSIGYTLGVSSCLVSYLNATAGMNIVAAMVIAVAAGVAIGFINGFLVTALKIDSFIATLATGFVLSGVIIAITNGNIITLSGLALTNATYNGFGPFPYALFYAVAGAAVVYYLVDHTPYGRYLRATGANSNAARLSGLDVPRLKVTSFVLAGLLASLAGILNLGQVGSADPTVGPAFLLPAFAAVFLGSTMFRPGQFNVQGLLVASLLLLVGVTGLGEVGAPSWVEPVFDGGVLLVAVAFSYGVQKRS
jgi:ribose transport system permease protein